MKLITLALLTLMPMIVQAKPMDCGMARLITETSTQVKIAKVRKIDADVLKFITCYGAFVKARCELYKGEIDKVTTEEYEYGALFCYKAFVEKKI